jgi:CheY-like chemotaxis protein
MPKELNILLVEDDPVDVRTVQRAFQRNALKHPLHVVGNGEQALAYLRGEPPFTDPAGPRRTDLILLDLNMPIMSGRETLRELKKDPRLRTIPVIVMTTSQEESDRFESFNLGVAGYILKPVVFERFVEAVRIIDQYWTLNEFAGEAPR